MEQDKKRINKKTLIVVLLLFGFMIVYSIRRSYLLSHYERYTIGTTVNTFYTVPATKHVTYTYKMNYKYYKEDDYYNFNSKVPGGRYYVRFSAKNPNVSEILQDQPVPDSIKAAPPAGWSKIP
jgi:hypothetical protein